MVKRRYQAFVSSTYEDLKEERKEVTQAILENDCFPAGMELFPASNKKQWDIIKKVIDESDFYIVLIAGKYGSLGEDEDGNKISYTEMEFDYAVKTNKPILAMLYSDIDQLPRSKCETSEVRNKRLKHFREKAKDGRMVRFWTDTGDLRASVGNAISKLIHDEDNKMLGWISAGKVTDINDNSQNHNQYIELLNKYIEKKRLIACYEQFILDCYNDPSRLSNADLKEQIEIRQEQEKRKQEEEERGYKQQKWDETIERITDGDEASIVDPVLNSVKNKATASQIEETTNSHNTSEAVNTGHTVKQTIIRTIWDVAKLETTATIHWNDIIIEVKIYPPGATLFYSDGRIFEVKDIPLIMGEFEYKDLPPEWQDTLKRQDELYKRHVNRKP